MNKSETQVLEIAKKFFGDGLENPDVLFIQQDIGFARYAYLKYIYNEDPVTYEFMKKPLRKLKVMDEYLMYLPCSVDGGYKCGVIKDILFQNGEVKFFQLTKICEYTSNAPQTLSPSDEEDIEKELYTLTGKRFHVIVRDSDLIVADSYIYPNIKESFSSQTSPKT